MSTQEKTRPTNRRDRGHPLLTPHEQLQFAAMLAVAAEAIEGMHDSGEHLVTYTNQTALYAAISVVLFALLSVGTAVSVLVLTTGARVTL